MVQSTVCGQEGEYGAVYSLSTRALDVQRQRWLRVRFSSQGSELAGSPSARNRRIGPNDSSKLQAVRRRAQGWCKLRWSFSQLDSTSRSLGRSGQVWSVRNTDRIAGLWHDVLAEKLMVDLVSCCCDDGVRLSSIP